MFEQESEKLWDYLATIVVSHDGYHLLSPVDQRYFVLSYFNGEVHNGGLAQGFMNDSGYYYDQVVQFLSEFNLEKLRDIIVSARDIFYGPDNKSTEYDGPECPVKEAIRKSIDDLDHAYFAFKDEFENILYSYAKSHGLFDNYV